MTKVTTLSCEGSQIRARIPGASGVLDGAGSDELATLLDLAYVHGNKNALEIVQLELSEVHSRIFEMPAPGTVSFSDLRRDMLVATTIEERMVAYETSLIDVGRFAGAELAPRAFVSALLEQIRNHPASQHPFYQDFLPHRSSVHDIAFYLAQEASLDPRFDDFIALMQVGMQVGPKLELASNYWDEMGNGEQHRIHSTMFKLVLNEVGVTTAFIANNTMVEARVCGNLSAALAIRKSLVYRAIGSFAVTEFLFPRRCTQLIKGWERNRLSDKAIAYHREHIKIDALHADGFFKNVIVPILSETPQAADDIYWGAMSRLNSSARYLDALMHHFN